MAVGLLAWFARRIVRPEARRGMAVALMIYFIVAGVLSLHGMAAGLMNAAGWVLFSANVLFALAYAWSLRGLRQSSSE